MIDHSKIKISSNRSFGIVFFFVFMIIALLPLLNNDSARVWPAIIAFFFLFLGLIKSKVLTPLNKIWFKFGILLGNIISPIVMGIVFFFVITPIGLSLRLFGKDLLNTKYDKKKQSYWIKREKFNNTMKKQF